MLFIDNDLLHFDFSSIISLIMGIVIGVSIAFLIYIIFIFLSFKKKKKIVMSKAVVSDTLLEDYIRLADKALNDSKTKGLKRVEYSIGLCKDITISMAESFFPTSKYPLFELSINESLQLMKYISNRIDELLDIPGLKLAKNVRLITIVKSQEVKDRLDDNFIYKNTKKYKLDKAFKSTMKVLNFFNPIWWSKKLIIDSSINLLLKKFCSVVVTITAEEAYKIYSKKVFLDEDTIQKELSSASDLMDENLKEIDKSYKKLVNARV